MQSRRGRSGSRVKKTSAPPCLGFRKRALCKISELLAYAARSASCGNANGRSASPSSSPTRSINAHQSYIFSIERICVENGVFDLTNLRMLKAVGQLRGRDRFPVWCIEVSLLVSPGQLELLQWCRTALVRVQLISDVFETMLLLGSLLEHKATRLTNTRIDVLEKKSEQPFERETCRC